MTKQKQSFLERLTGSRSVDDSSESFPVYAEEETEMVMHTTNPMTTQHIMQEETWNQSVASDTEGQLTIDVYQTDNDIVIKSTIAGVKPEDLDISINNDMVTIKGERKNEEVIDHGNYYYQECYWGSFSRSVLLPVDVISDKTEASLKNGILTLRLPKADTTKIKKIQVRGF
ncbi:MAG: Hsp20/alpha crystallin family protein [Candidatus Moranbacteria bacterium]|nr:Hsp20/alpha crystallin family protein [Candidatus Moranbacteria bacterium]